MWHVVFDGFWNVNPSKSLIGFHRIAVVYPYGRLYFKLGLYLTRLQAKVIMVQVGVH